MNNSPKIIWDYLNCSAGAVHHYVGKKLPAICMSSVYVTAGSSVFLKDVNSHRKMGIWGPFSACSPTEASGLLKTGVFHLTLRQTPAFTQLHGYSNRTVQNTVLPTIPPRKVSFF